MVRIVLMVVLVLPALGQAGDVALVLSRDGDALVARACGLVRGDVLRGGWAAGGYLVDGGLDGLAREGRSLRVTGDGGCVAWRVDAARAAGERRSGRGYAVGDGWLLDPAVWLWRPRGRDLVVAVHGGEEFRASMPWPVDADGRWRIAAKDTTSPAWTAFGAVDRRSVGEPGGQLRVAVMGARDRAHADLLHAWIAEVATAARSVHARMPLPDAQVLVVPIDGRGTVPWGQTTRGGAAAVQLFPSRDASLDALRADWVAAHELAHLFHPYLGNRGRWLSEGLASYYQNVIRARAGLIDEAEAWRRLHAGFERGRRNRYALPLEAVSARMRELGANMRTYWSGAAFWLEVDVALRGRGDSLDAVLGRFRDCCLPAQGRWDPERFVAELDRLAGAPVAAPRYRRMATSSDFPDLGSVYARLGLSEAGRRLEFAAGEPWRLRREIMAPRRSRG